MQIYNIKASDVTDGGQRGEFPPSGKLNVKTGPLFNLYFNFSIRLVFSRLLNFGIFRTIFR